MVKAPVDRSRSGTAGVRPLHLHAGIQGVDAAGDARRCSLTNYDAPVLSHTSGEWQLYGLRILGDGACGEEEECNSWFHSSDLSQVVFGIATR